MTTFTDPQAPPVTSQPLPPGMPAPDFELPSHQQGTVSLKDFRGRPVILAFYPADWSPVCSDQMVIYQQIAPEFEKYNAQVVGISVDSVWCHRAWSRDRHIEYPLLADFEPKGGVACDYRVYRLPEGVTERALFVIDRDGTIHWSYVSDIHVNPGADGILNALEDLAAKDQVDHR